MSSKSDLNKYYASKFGRKYQKYLTKSQTSIRVQIVYTTGIESERYVLYLQ